MEPNRWFRSHRDFLDLDALAQHLHEQFQKRQSRKYFVLGGRGYPLLPVEAPGEEEGSLLRKRNLLVSDSFEIGPLGLKPADCFKPAHDFF